ncbi:DUF4249 family protein [candidate division WOR-3 bacterium]|nr:DUF4249 family protein [candidate division WOR-3 bacterium]
MRRVVPILSLMLIGSCDLNPDDYQREPNIYCFLSTDSTSVEVLAGQTAAVGDTIPIEFVFDTTVSVDPLTGDTSYYINTFWYYAWNGVEDARIRLSNEYSGQLLAGNSDSTGRFFADSIRVKRGETWTLEIIYPEGDTVFAQTTVPDSFEITYPEGDTIGEEDSLAWNSAMGAAGYAVSYLVWFWAENNDSIYVDTASFKYIYLYPGESRLYYDWWITWIEIVDSIEFSITALDTNACDYFWFARNAYFYLNPDDYMHIPGAVGLFGSATTVKTKRYVVKHLPDTGGIPLHMLVDK